MSDKPRAPKPALSGPGAILGGLAVGAILGTPVAAVANECAAEVTSTVTTTASSISEQFRDSFTAGVVIAPVTDITLIICGEN
ncbi:MAG TPA: hypothetical protein VFT95_02935 [Micromonosporaceae bacterium]|nr:hypothetical protein [Micromonosporaceae bacterium]